MRYTHLLLEVCAKRNFDFDATSNPQMNVFFAGKSEL